MNIEKVILKRVNSCFTGPIEYVPSSGVYVRYQGGKAQIGNGSLSEMTRGLALLAKGIQEGKDSFEIHQKPQFDTRGVQIDLSRCAVMRVSVVKEYLEYMACLGLNTLILYMEDVYQLKGYPYFGYMRGAYSEEELREMDDYATELGIQIIPHIQVLGHMEQYLKWPAAAEVKGTNDVLLCGEEKTYQLIDAMLQTMRRCFRSNRIHIGCDETQGLELGNYLKRNGYQNGMQVMLDHTNRVVDMCKEYQFSPIIYSDMLFDLCADCRGIYDPDTTFTQDVLDKIPHADLAYWDYCRKAEEEVAIRIEKHKLLGRNILYFGGLWSWNDLLPRYAFTMMGLVNGMKAAMHNGIREMIATTWGDNGNECNRGYDLFAFPVISEVCFLGDTFREDDAYDMSHFLFGIQKDFFLHAGALAMPMIESRWYGIVDTFYGRGLFYTDLLYNLTGTETVYAEHLDSYKAALNVMRGGFEQEKWDIFRRNAEKIYEILVIKAELISNLRQRYKAGDRAYLTQVAESTLPALIAKYKELLPIWQTMWLQTYKPFGWEITNGRLGYITVRLEYALQTLRSYLDGTLSTIEELDADFIENPKLSRITNFVNMASTSCYA